MTTTNDTTTRQAIAQTILAQLGGGRFAVMTGAKQFMALESGLAFKLPSNFASKGINHVRVVLTPADLYDVTFSKVRGLKCTTVASFEGVYCDQLRDIVSSTTGLALSLGTMGRRA